MDASLDASLGGRATAGSGHEVDVVEAGPLAQMCIAPVTAFLLVLWSVGMVHTFTSCRSAQLHLSGLGL